MTMLPARNVLQQHYINNYGGCLVGHSQGGAGAPCPNVKCTFGSDPTISLMAEDESRASSSSRHIQEEKEEGEEEGEERDVGWLQLGIGGHASRELRIDHSMESSSQRGGLIELDLFSHKNHTAPTAPSFHVTNYQGPLPIPHTASATTSSAIAAAAAMPLYLPHPRSTLSFRQPLPGVAWDYRQASSSSTPYYPHPYMMGPPPVADAGPSSGVRVVDVPLRRQSGIWFVLQASQIQGKEPFLPQIPKSYLRIKDGRMTVRLLMKYLANKMGLNNESEVEITCKGQQLLPFLTLQHVRDNIWCSRDPVTLLPDSTSSDHVMVLDYGRSA
ncbi:putative RING finger protein [Cinnamomum micranthum f. kanehirae]|uniref:Putative RING finger protein n=1 Tax=Cinnamomum micranthum f. kanehirae TaxID=337451 RepID=A0A3S3QMZ6_9MAGN|nr:putative RING finger protein [Cinnamomum micranthum f. kanehirae]